MKKRIIVKVFGEVQGVFFRVGVREKAEELRLVGWVRNVADGTVEILAEGEEGNLKKLISYCKEGPRFAKVERVEVEWEEASGEFGEFMIR